MIKNYDKRAEITFSVTANSEQEIRSHYKKNANLKVTHTGDSVYEVFKNEKNNARADEIMYFTGKGLRGNRKGFSMHWNWQAIPKMTHKEKDYHEGGYTEAFISHYKNLCFVDEQATNPDKTTHIIFTSGGKDGVTFKNQSRTTIAKKKIFAMLNNSGFSLNETDMDSMIATNQGEIERVKGSSQPLKFYFLNTKDAVPLYQELTSDSTNNNQNEVPLFIHTTC